MLWWVMYRILMEKAPGLRSPQLGTKGEGFNVIVLCVCVYVFWCAGGGPPGQWVEYDRNIGGKRLYAGLRVWLEALESDRSRKAEVVLSDAALEV